MIAALEIIGGLIILFFSGDALVKGAVGIAKKLGISIIVIGLTVVAIGTSAPEMLVSISAALKGLSDIALGNIIGSNIANVGLVLAISALVAPLIPHDNIIKRESPFLFIISILFTALVFFNQLNALTGVLLMVVLCSYLIFLVKRATRDKKNEATKLLEQEMAEEFDKPIPPLKATLLVLLGIGGLALGSELLVMGAVTVAEMFKIPEAVISVTLIAIGSSSPELATCVIAAFRKHTDIIIGNIIGSNLFNILLGIGIPVLINPLQVNPAFLQLDLWVMLALAILLAGFIHFQKSISRLQGGLFFIVYLGYITTLVINVME